MDNTYQELLTEHRIKFIESIIFNYEKFEDLSTNDQKHFRETLKKLDSKDLHSILLNNSFCQDFDSSSEEWLKFFLNNVSKDFFKIKNSNKYAPMQAKEENFIYSQIRQNINMGAGLWKAIEIALPYYDYKSKGFHQVVTSSILLNLHDLGIDSHSRVSSEEQIIIQKKIFQELEKYEIFSSLHPLDFMKYVLNSEDQPNFFIGHFDMIDKYIDWNSHDTITWLEENILSSYRYSSLEDRSNFFIAMDLISSKLNKKLTFNLENYTDIVKNLKKGTNTEEFNDLSKLYHYVNINLSNIEPELLQIVEKATVYQDILKMEPPTKKKEKHKI